MKNVLLIGGSHGIGLSIVKELQETHKIYVASRTDEALSHHNIVHIEFDATKDTLDITKLPEKIDGFVYCPGSINLKPFKMMGLTTFKEDMELNFFSLVNVVKTIISKMDEGSSMVFFSTIAVGTGNKKYVFHLK